MRAGRAGWWGNGGVGGVWLEFRGGRMVSWLGAGGVGEMGVGEMIYLLWGGGENWVGKWELKGLGLGGCV